MLKFILSAIVSLGLGAAAFAAEGTDAPATGDAMKNEAPAAPAPKAEKPMKKGGKHHKAKKAE